MLGLSGPHRSGKTTLAREFSEIAPMHLLETNATGVFEDLHLDPKADYSFAKRLDIQNAILDTFEKQYQDAHGMFISDRTPLDLMAYTLADAGRGNLSDADNSNLRNYLKRCQRVAVRHFSQIFIIQPGILPVEAAGKAPASFGYVEHINALIKGLAVDAAFSDVRIRVIGRRVLSLSDRVAFLNSAHTHYLQQQVQNASYQKEGLQ